MIRIYTYLTGFSFIASLCRRPACAIVVILLLVVAIGGSGCKKSEKKHRLDVLGKANIKIKGQDFELWIADEEPERNKGLMFVTAEEMAPKKDGTPRGMIFVFDYDAVSSFWMKNTIIPLDIAYITKDGTVVACHRMAPLDTTPGKYSSRRPARFAIEVNAGVWSELGLSVGDRIDIPDSLLNRTP